MQWKLQGYSAWVPNALGPYSTTRLLQHSCYIPTLYMSIVIPFEQPRVRSITTCPLSRTLFSFQIVPDRSSQHLLRGILSRLNTIYNIAHSKHYSVYSSRRSTPDSQTHGLSTQTRRLAASALFRRRRQVKPSRHGSISIVKLHVSTTEHSHTCLMDSASTFWSINRLRGLGKCLLHDLALEHEEKQRAQEIRTKGLESVRNRERRGP